ncbi:hypothetical protein, partial [Mesorhizobium sp. M1365]|uniref:hypothetical protein n=1 Tax=Mesorhizobium sp. M1365 TaxID=2957090 RepID=UPI00333C467E
TTVPWPLAPQSKPRSLSKTFCRTFSTLSPAQNQVEAIKSLDLASPAATETLQLLASHRSIAVTA